MAISGQMAVDNELIVDPIEDGIRTASYDLHIGSILVDGEAQPSGFSLASGALAILVSKEHVHMHPGWVAYALPKTSLGNKGLLALSTGLVDPGWKGPISTIVINFHRDKIRLQNGAKFLRLAFHRLEGADRMKEPEYVRSFTSDEYTRLRQDASNSLPKTFLNLPTHIESISAELMTRFNRDLLKVVAILGALIAFLGMVVPFVLTLASTPKPALSEAQLQLLLNSATEVSAVRANDERLDEIEEALHEVQRVLDANEAADR